MLILMPGVEISTNLPDVQFDFLNYVLEYICLNFFKHGKYVCDTELIGLLKLIPKHASRNLADFNSDSVFRWHKSH